MYNFVHECAVQFKTGFLLWKPKQGINAMKIVGNLLCTSVSIPLKSRMPESWRISNPTPAVIYGTLNTLYVEM